MSAFDDEFGLFGENEEGERRSTLGARKIASNETIIDDIEPEEERPRSRAGGGRPAPFKGGGARHRHGGQNRQPADPQAARERASTLLEFLAKKLVAKPDDVLVDHYPPENGESALIELIVDPEDIGKVIGRNGRVAQALRTIVRATAEGRVSVEIYDSDEIAEAENESGEEDGAAE